MIVRHMLFEDVSNVENARDWFIRFNPELDVSRWDFEMVARTTAIATPKNGKLFFIQSPCHFGWWIQEE